METKKRIVIDAGHGGAEPGAIYEGRKEKDDNLRLALAVGRLLEGAGADVFYTRVNDVFDSPLEKAQMANEAEGDFLISIHRNAMPQPGTGSGILSLVYQMGGPAERVAQSINGELAQLGFQDLGIAERPGLVILRRSNMPAVLLEAGFIDNISDNEQFDNQFNQIAQAIADGVLKAAAQEGAREPEFYQVQIGAYENKAMAAALTRELQSKGYPAFMVYQDGYYKVRVGAFLNMDNGVNMERELRRNGYPTMLIREKKIG